MGRAAAGKDHDEEPCAVRPAYPAPAKEREVIEAEVSGLQVVWVRGEDVWFYRGAGERILEDYVYAM